MGQNGRTLKDSLPFIPLGFFLGPSLITVLRKQGCVEGEERGVRPSCLPRHEKLNNGIFIMKPVTKTNAC